MKKKSVDSSNHGYYRLCAGRLRGIFPLLKAYGLLLWLGLMSANAMAQNSPQSPPDTIAQRVAACTACHGKEGRAASDGFYPRIAGKPAGYLYNQLVNFREGRRKYPLMIYLVSPLSDAYLHEIADYFSSLHPPYPSQQAATASQTVLEQGRVLVQFGNAAKNVPACIACHGKTLTGIAPSIPGLIGLPGDYMNAQFGAWKNGTRRAMAPDCMATISSRLDIEEINAALAWIAAQPIPAQTTPAANATETLPTPCGSLPQQSQQPQQPHQQPHQ